jgi:hypothetical protein
MFIQERNPLMHHRIKIVVLLCTILSSAALAGSREDVIAKLNSSSSTEGTENVKSWRLLFDGCLEITAPPKPLSDDFNMNTVWPGMEGWSEVAAWSAHNEHMERVFIESAKRVLVGLPYGGEHVPNAYQEAGIVAEIGVDGNLHTFDFSYVDVVKVASLWATSESYRLFEQGSTDRAIKLLMSQLIVLRKFCDREFLKEQLIFMPMLADALKNTRDMFYNYREQVTSIQFRTIAKEWIPFLQTGSNRLLMPEGDRVVGEALVRELFKANGEPDPAKFREILTDVQADREPITRFGAAKYWGLIAKVHRGRDDSLNRLNLIYDDWWRRWKMRTFHPQLLIDTELQKSNPVKYAAVNLIIRDIKELFLQRDLLTTQINGTAVSAALCGYINHYKVYPSAIKKMYAQLLNRSSNLDYLRPLDLRSESDWELYSYPVGAFHYRKIQKDTNVFTLLGNVVVKSGECLLYSVSTDNEDNRGLNVGEDIIIWPPLKTLERNAGLLD